MVAYSFKRRFVEPMLWGRKDGTIRLPRDGASRHCGGFRVGLRPDPGPTDRLAAAGAASCRPGHASR